MPTSSLTALTLFKYLAPVSFEWLLWVCPLPTYCTWLRALLRNSLLSAQAAVRIESHSAGSALSSTENSRSIAK